MDCGGSDGVQEARLAEGERDAAGCARDAAAVDGVSAAVGDIMMPRKPRLPCQHQQ